MDSNKQLKDLKEEIDAVNDKIDDKEAKWANAANADKDFYRNSLERLNARLEVLIADRSRLLATLAPAPAPGKTPQPPSTLTPSLCMRTYNPPPVKVTHCS